MLMESGGDPNVLNKNGYAPLHLAVIYGCVKVFKWVINYNIKLNDAQYSH